MTRQRLAAASIGALVAFGAAWVALLPGLDFWDTGELQTVAPILGTAHPTGFPTYVILGWLASVVLQPFGDPALRMNLFSALCVAVAAGVTVDLVRTLTRSTALGLMAGIGLALTPIVWKIGTHAEAHSLHLALIAILLRLLVAWEERVRGPRAEGATEVASASVAQTSVASASVGDASAADRGDRYLVASAVVYGLAMGNHSLTLLLAVPVALFVLAVDPRIWRRWRLVLGCVAALALTVVAVYAELPLRAGPFRAPLVYGTPGTWTGFLYVTLAEQFQGSLVDPFGDLPRKLGELVGRTVQQFGILAPLIPIGFVATAVRRPRFALLTGSAAAITCFFSASYVNADIGRYYLVPVLIAWTWLAILASYAVDAVAVATGEPMLDEPATEDDGMPSVEAEGTGAPDVDGVTPADGGRRRWASVGGPRTWAGSASVVIAVFLLAPSLMAAQTRYAAVDERRSTGAQQFADHVMKTVEPNAVIVSWWSYSTPLWYAQLVQGQRPDVWIVDDRTRLDQGLGDVDDVIDANLGKRPVYVIRADPREVTGLATRYTLDYIDGVDASSLTKVVSRRAG